MAIGIQKVTPTIVKRWRDAFIGLLAGCLPFAANFMQWFHLTGEMFAGIIGISILVVNFGAKLFGLEDEAAIDQLQSKIDSIKKSQGV